VNTHGAVCLLVILLYHVEFRDFKGWGFRYPAAHKLGPLDSLQRDSLWKLQHPLYEFGNKPDYFVEGSISGPFPGFIHPFFGEFAKRTTFLLGFKYEDSQLAFPNVPRNNHVDWNGLK
jgi:hypothetical protein